MANNLKVQSFLTMSALKAYVNDAASDVVTIVSIFFDSASGQFVLCYTPT